MSTPTSGDLLLVNRGGVNYQIDYDDMSTLQDTDLLLVNRAGVNYQIPASDLDLGPDGLIIPSVEVLTPVNGAGLDEGSSYTPISSAYVSTDSTPVYNRYFPQAITTVSGGTWTDPNFIFDGNNGTIGKLSGAAGVISEVVYTNHASFSRSGETDVWTSAYPGGGTIEIIDENDTVLRTYNITEALGPIAVGIVNADNKIRLKSTNQDAYLWISAVKVGGSDLVDSVISGRVAFEFTDDTDLDKMVAPIIMTDANGDIKVPTTSTVNSTTSIPGVNKGVQFKFAGNGSGNTVTIQASDSLGAYWMTAVGPRMAWAKVDGGLSHKSTVVTDNVTSLGLYLEAANLSGRHSGGPILNENASEYVPNSRWNSAGYNTYIAEIGVSAKVLDIVTWEGNGSSLREIPHNLGTKPGMIITKCLTNSSRWPVWHKDLSAGKFLELDNGEFEGNYYNAFMAEPTKDAFYIGSSTQINNTGETYVAYVFAADTPGKIKCGTYEGAGSNQVIDVGFKTGFFITKNKYASNGWGMSTEQASDDGKFWELSSEGSMQGGGSNYINMSYGSTAFEIRGNDARLNNSGSTYVYIAIAEDLAGPASTQLNLLSGQDLEYFTAGTQITSNLSASGSNQAFGTEIYSGNGSASRNIQLGTSTNRWFDLSYDTGNKALMWFKSLNGSQLHYLVDTERNYNQYLSSSSGLNYEEYGAFQGPYTNTGYSLGGDSKVNGNSFNYVSWNFLSAPQFFDIQRWTGNSASQTITHDLGVEAGFIMVKCFSQPQNWICYHSELTNGKLLYLDSPSGEYTSSMISNVTDTSFTLNNNGAVNGINQSYIAYIFAKDTSYVKCGEYTAPNPAGVLQVNVGFQPRWVMIKCKSSSGDWVIFDKNMAGGAYVRANESGTQDYAGFSVTADGFRITDYNNADYNNAGAEFIYIAIADESVGHPPSLPSTATVSETPDPATATMVVSAESFDVGDSASAPALNASITSVGGSEGSTLYVDSSTGTWLPGLYAKGSETTVSAPSADEITFTSTNAGTTSFSGVDATLSSRTWTLESGPSATGPWTVVDTYVDYDALASQDGATPWSSNKPALAADTFYRVKVQYDSTNAESVESVYSTFKTSA